MLRVCLDCLTRFAADLKKCPHCLSRKSKLAYEFAGEHGPELVSPPAEDAKVVPKP